jgi:hypothetical protein
MPYQSIVQGRGLKIPNAALSENIYYLFRYMHMLFRGKYRRFIEFFDHVFQLIFHAGDDLACAHPAYGKPLSYKN